jgi:release factor glutamine methyltransferase
MQIQQSPIDAQWTILKIIQWATSYFKSNHIDSPRLTIEILLAHVLRVERIHLYLDFERPLDSDELAHLKSLVKRRLSREPVAYITGKKEFFGNEFSVSGDVLIPRPETEFLVEEALNYIPEQGKEPVRIIDMGTGSGAVIVSLAKNRPGHHYFASDISYAALAIAKDNARTLEAGGIGFYAGKWFEPLNASDKPFDMIVSNPPYIPTAEIDNLEPEIRRYEPLSALDGGDDGMNALRELIRSAPAYMKPGGVMLLEIGHDQRLKVQKEMNKSNRLRLEKFVRDYGGHDRVAVLKRTK